MDKKTIFSLLTRLQRLRSSSRHSQKVNLIKNSIFSLLTRLFSSRDSFRPKRIKIDLSTRKNSYLEIAKTLEIEPRPKIDHGSGKSADLERPSDLGIHLGGRKIDTSEVP